MDLQTASLQDLSLELLRTDLAIADTHLALVCVLAAEVLFAHDAGDFERADAALAELLAIQPIDDE